MYFSFLLPPLLILFSFPFFFFFLLSSFLSYFSCGSPYRDDDIILDRSLRWFLPPLLSTLLPAFVLLQFTISDVISLSRSLHVLSLLFLSLSLPCFFKISYSLFLKRKTFLTNYYHYFSLYFWNSTFIFICNTFLVCIIWIYFFVKRYSKTILLLLYMITIYMHICYVLYYIFSVLYYSVSLRNNNCVYSLLRT